VERERDRCRSWMKRRPQHFGPVVNEVSQRRAPDELQPMAIGTAEQDKTCPQVDA